MFDTIAGLPIHPLVVHAAVVLGPLAALLLVIYVIKADWRMALRWPTVLTGVGAGLSAAVAASSGESLQHRVDQLASAAQRSLVEEHAEAERNGLALNPTNADDALFDEAIAEIYHTQQALRRQDQASMME